MKRTSVLALGFALLLSFSGCSRQQAPVSTADDSSSVGAAVAESTEPAAPNAAAESNPATEAEALGEQITETGSAESAEASAAGAQTLALRIAETRPEAASKWQEGVHYNRLVPAQPTNASPGQVEVTEVFWYGCPHCYALEPYLEAWRKNNKPAFVSFVRLPVMWSPGHAAHARMFYTAETLGKLDELHGKLFREMHINNNPLNSPASIERFFTGNGVSQADFQRTFSSFAVESSLKRAEAMGLRYKVESVPLIVVNGKYVTDVGRAGGQQQLIELINALAVRERGA